MTTVLDSLRQIDLAQPVSISVSEVASSTLNGHWFLRGHTLAWSEKALLGLPGVNLIVPNTLTNPAELLSAAQADSNSVFFIDDKRLHPCELLSAGRGDLLNWAVESNAARYPTFTLHPEYPPALTIAAYGYGFELARAAALELMMQREIFCEIVVFSQLAPLDFAPLAASLATTRRLVTVEDEPLAFGWGAELIARAAALDIRRFKVRRVALPDSATSSIIVSTILEMLGQKIR